MPLTSSNTFHVARSPLGPWTGQTVAMPYPCFTENLAPSPQFHPNGTLYVVFHCDTKAGFAMGDLVMVSAPSWEGPFANRIASVFLD